MRRQPAGESPAHRPAGSRRSESSLARLLLFSAALLAVFFGAWELVERFFLVNVVPATTLHVLHILRGVNASVLLALFVGWYLVRHPVHAFRDAERSFDPIGQLRWLVRMRWIAAGFTLALIVIAVPITGVLAMSHLPVLLSWWAILVAGNLYFGSLLEHDPNFDDQVIAQMALDTVIVTGLLNASGGIENPLSIGYLFGVFIAGILLPKRKALGITFLAAAALSFLALGELFHILPHASTLLFPHATGIDDAIHHQAAHDPVFVFSRLTSLLGVMFVTSYFTTLVMERLRASEHHLAGVIEAAGFGMLVTDATGEVVWMNARWCGAGFPACPPGGGLESPPHTGASEEEIALPSPDGGIRHFRHATFPVRDAANDVVQVVHVVEDITSRKELESEALHASRLAVLGQLAAGVAHEIGNPLSSLHARVQLMKRRPDPDSIRESLDVLEKQIDRIGRIVRGVSHLARNRYESRTLVDIEAIVREAVTLVKIDRRAANVVIADDIAAGLPPVRGMRDELLQVTINLMLNAVEAMPNGGSLRAVAFAADGSVHIAISDTGAGIDDSVRARLFEPFFTTKPEGTGLGLSICHSLVHAHGGTIEVATEAGRGSRFTIVLPAVRPESATTEAVA